MRRWGTHSSDHPFHFADVLFRARVFLRGLGHQLDVLPRVVALGVLLSFEVVEVVLQVEEAFPVGWRERVVLAEEKETNEKTDGVGKDFWVEAFEDLAFVFVVVLPGRLLACLEKRIISRMDRRRWKCTRIKTQPR